LIALFTMVCSYARTASGMVHIRDTAIDRLMRMGSATVGIKLL